MAVTSNKVHSDFSSYIYQSDSTSTCDNDILTNGTGRVYMIKYDNSHGSSGSGYLKLYDAKQATHGTTTPVMIVYMKAITATTITMRQGLSISTGLCVCSAAEDGTGSSASSDITQTQTYDIVGS